MIDKDTVMRVARPTDNLADITNMYCDGLGFELLATFSGHNDFDGAIIGHPHHNYHLEFTHRRGTHVGPAPSQENLLVFYLPDHAAWQTACQQIEAAGFKPVPSYNSYWDKDGRTFEDLDGYRVVLQNREWAY